MKNLFTIPFVLFSSYVFADFNSALDSYGAGKYTEAYTEFLAMAETGEKRSQFNLGVMYYQGQHVEKDIDMAYAWLKLSIQGETSSEDNKKTFEIIKNQIADLSNAENNFKSLEAQYSTQVLIEKLYPTFVKADNGNAYNAVPTKIVSPRYPIKAAKSNIQGWTRFRFDLDILGVPRNIQLVESFPKKVFASTSRKAIQKWQFEPAVNQQGEAVAQPNIMYTMQFRLSGLGPIAIKEGVFENYLIKARAGDLNAQFNVGYLDKKLNLTGGKENPAEWFLKAAVQGHYVAQYELGKSLVYGQGCELDKAKGVEWLTRSAHNGYSEAKQLLATVATRVKTLESHQKAIAYLQGVEELSATTQLNYAWMLATSPFEEIANPKKSLSIVKNMSKKTFNDDITLYEIRAAAHAALGDFDEAVDLQEDALEEAEDRKADTASIQKHLSSYKKNQKWF